MFQGVATKYLDNYLFWHRFLELNKKMPKGNASLLLLKGKLYYHSTSKRSIIPFIVLCGQFYYFSLIHKLLRKQKIHIRL